MSKTAEDLTVELRAIAPSISKSKGALILDCIQNDGDTLRDYQSSRDFITQSLVRDLERQQAELTQIDAEIEKMLETFDYKLTTLPGVGSAKNADEAAALLKGVLGNTDALLPALKTITKNGDEAGTVLKRMFGNTDEAGTALKGILGSTDEAAGNVGKTAKAVAGEPDELDKAIDAVWNSDELASDIITEGAGDVTGSLDGLTPAERKMIDDLTKQGKNVETIPRSNVPGGKTPDFNVNNVKTELKTMQNPNTNTGMKRIQEGFGQGAETVIIDARGSGLTRTQASEIINRAKGKYLNGQLPGKVEIWIDGQIITYP